jgi:hypothetical protein
MLPSKIFVDGGGEGDGGVGGGGGGGFWQLLVMQWQ